MRRHSAGGGAAPDLLYVTRVNACFLHYALSIKDGLHYNAVYEVGLAMLQLLYAVYTLYNVLSKSWRAWRGCN